jgi:hypothetical protein
MLEVQHRTMACRDDHTREALRGTGIECPAFDETFVQRYVTFFKASGLL